MVQTVLGGTQGAADIRHIIDGVLNNIQSLGSTILIANVQGINFQRITMTVINRDIQPIECLGCITNL